MLDLVQRDRLKRSLRVLVSVIASTSFVSFRAQRGIHIVWMLHFADASFSVTGRGCGCLVLFSMAVQLQGKGHNWFNLHHIYGLLLRLNQF
jgi:hypothetical protein